MEKRGQFLMAALGHNRSGMGLSHTYQFYLLGIFLYRILGGTFDLSPILILYDPGHKL